MGGRPHVLHFYAVCVSCGATADWTPVLGDDARREIVLTGRRELALRADSERACRPCGGTRLELRVEDWTTRS
jgi:hypothetical protein